MIIQISCSKTNGNIYWIIDVFVFIQDFIHYLRDFRGKVKIKSENIQLKELDTQRKRTAEEYAEGNRKQKSRK